MRSFCYKDKENIHMKNKSILQFVSIIDCVVRVLIVVFVVVSIIAFVTKIYIVREIMVYAFVFILLFVVWGIIMRIVFKKRELKENEIDSITPGILFGLLLLTIEICVCLYFKIIDLLL